MFVVDEVDTAAAQDVSIGLATRTADVWTVAPIIESVPYLVNIDVSPDGSRLRYTERDVLAFSDWVAAFT